MIHNAQAVCGKARQKARKARNAARYIRDSKRIADARGEKIEDSWGRKIILR